MSVHVFADIDGHSTTPPLSLEGRCNFDHIVSKMFSYTYVANVSTAFATLQCLSRNTTIEITTASNGHIGVSYRRGG
jgi:hypothetical protein